MVRSPTALPAIGRQRLGDQAALHAGKHACYFLDSTYVACPDRHTGRMRYRPGFAALCEPARRHLPQYLDSAAYREFTSGAPAWSGYERYCESVDLIKPDVAMAKDVVGDQEASRCGYERICADGYRDLAIRQEELAEGSRPTDGAGLTQLAIRSESGAALESTARFEQGFLRAESVLCLLGSF